MCGIVGLYDPRGLGTRDNVRATLHTMCVAMRHRGPDDVGDFVSSKLDAALGNVRLAVIDLSAAGHMPMASDDGAVQLTYNGEIYNFAEVGHELVQLGHRFRSHTDTEVLLRAYQQWGLECVRRVRGMFAFAIWDSNERRLLLARDRMGIKPLYYARLGGSLVFASELRALLASRRLSRRISAAGVAHYLAAGSVPCPLTIYEGVNVLPPGRLLVAQGGRCELRSYWELPTSQAGRIARADAVADVRHRLQGAVRSQLVSDVPLGAFLSGGIDSSALVGLMRQATNGVIRTCSVVFDEASHDERPYARAVAEAHGCEHVEVPLTASEVGRELPRAVQAMDQPTIDGVNTYFVSRTAKQTGLTVALSGLGGDELFGGYHTFRLVPRVYRAARLAHATPFAPPLVSAALQHWPLGSTPRRLSDAFRGWPSLARSYRAVRGVFGLGGAQALLQPDVADAVAGATLDAEPRDGTSGEAWDQVSRLELRGYMHDQLLRDADALSMAHSLEVRVPLLDETVVEYVLQLPAAARASGAVAKSLLRAAVDDLLPPLVKHRTTKQGFTFPFGAWLRTALAPVLTDALESGASASGMLRPDALRRLRAEYAEGHLHWSRLWAVAVLELWLRQEGEATLPGAAAYGVGSHE